MENLGVMVAVDWKSFWRRRRVFVTGHNGFLGTWMCLALNHLGANVCGFSLDPPSDPNLSEILGADERISACRGDIADFEAISTTLSRFHPEIVLHLAAQPIVRRAYRDPLNTINVNIMGTANLLEAVRMSPGILGLVIFTTDKVYENLETGRPFGEGDRLGGKEPYGAGKACAEILVEAYRASYFSSSHAAIPVATIRAGNLIGPGDWGEDRLIPDAVRALGKSEVLEVRHPGATRPWQHVMDAVRGTLMIAQALAGRSDVADGPWNLGPDSSEIKTVGWMAERIVTIWGDGAKWRVSEIPDTVESTQLLLDVGRAQRTFGWKAHWTVEECLRDTIAWYRDWYMGLDIACRTEQQLNRGLYA